LPPLPQVKALLSTWKKIPQDLEKVSELFRINNKNKLRMSYLKNFQCWVNEQFSDPMSYDPVEQLVNVDLPGAGYRQLDQVPPKAQQYVSQHQGDFTAYSREDGDTLLMVTLDGNRRLFYFIDRAEPGPFDLRTAFSKIKE
jgi:hypothetical protein